MVRGTPVLLSIQVLRALAALAVVAYHALQWDRGGFDVGRAGVDVFFVISGFIMWHVTSGRDVAPGAFLWRRFTRVAPLYWLATLGALAVALVWPAFLPEVRPGWRHLALSLAFVPHLDPRGLPFPTLPPGWTLDYEALFYAIFAAALAGPRAWRGRLVVGALIAVTAFGFLVPEPFYYLGANPMLLQFAAGVGLGWISHRERPRRPARSDVGAAMIPAALAWWTAVQAGGLFTELWRPLLWGGSGRFLTVGGRPGPGVERGRARSEHQPGRRARRGCSAIALLRHLHPAPRRRPRWWPMPWATASPGSSSPPPWPLHWRPVWPDGPGWRSRCSPALVSGQPPETAKRREAPPQGHLTTGGMDERIDSMLPPVFRPNIVPRS